MNFVILELADVHEHEAYPGGWRPLASCAVLVQVRIFQHVCLLRSLFLFFPLRTLWFLIV